MLQPSIITPTSITQADGIQTQCTNVRSIARNGIYIQGVATPSCALAATYIASRGTLRQQQGQGTNSYEQPAQRGYKMLLGEVLMSLRPFAGFDRSAIAVLPTIASHLYILLQAPKPSSYSPPCKSPGVSLRTVTSRNNNCKPMATTAITLY